jgi:hypothetical protein
LITLLVLFAALTLLFADRYPKGIFDFVLGLDRWVARVAAYAALMTDRYPPFRLDQGGSEQGTVPLAPPLPEPSAGEPEPTGPASPPPSGGGGRIALLVLGAIVALLAFALLASGCAAVVIDRTQRDDDGFVMTPTEDFATDSYAIVAESVDVDLDGPDWAVEDFIGTVRIRSESERPVFVGIARDDDVDAYLGSVERGVVDDVDEGKHLSERSGGAPAGPPAEQDFWVASTSGAGERTLDWEPEDGSWSAVVMNTDASRDVQSDLSIGAELDSLPWIGVGVLIGGALLAAGAAAAITAGVRRGR